jgi:hypothetical protein
MKQLTMLLIILFSASAFAAADVFSTLDVNNDNAISKEEATSLPGLINSWKQLDVNADDQLSSTEFQEYAKTSEVTSTPDIDSQRLELN